MRASAEPPLEPLLPIEAEEYLSWLVSERGRSRSTVAAYRRDLRAYSAWLAERGAPIDAAAIEAELDTADLPPLDLVIRTSGEQRLSNFLLWQAAYTEFVFSDCLWPEFGERELDAAIAAFHERDRRFGGVKDTAVAA